MFKWQLILTYDGESIVLEQDSERYIIESMFVWYMNHKKFFKGEFSIRGVAYDN